MLCEHCGKNVATTHYKSYINGKFTEKHLCGKCAALLGINENPFFNAFSSVFGNNELTESTKRCPSCGTSFNEIAETGLVGCSECYTHFRNELIPSVKMMHGTTKHIQKVQKPENTKENEINKLKKELQKAIKEERFEDAARLRDEIKTEEGKK